MSVRRDPFESIIQRKEKYIEFTTDIGSIHLNLLRWEFRLPKIETSISFNITYNFLLNFYLNLNLAFPVEALTFFSENIEVEQKPELKPNYVQQYPKLEKAKYGVSKYDYSYYDPPEVTYDDLVRFIWNLRYQLTEKSYPAYKKVSDAIKKYIEAHKDILIQKGVKPEYIEAMVESLLQAEGKVLNSAYVGYAIVNVSKVVKKGEITVARRKMKVGVRKQRWTDDYKTEKDVPTLYPYESLVNYTRVNHARVLATPETFKETHLKPLAKVLERRIKEFHKRSCWTPIEKGLDVEVKPEVKEITEKAKPQDKTLYQRVFFLQKRDKMKWEGGKHQARLQHIIELTKKVLDKHGVFGVNRIGYIAFAKEWCYLLYKPHRKYKHWKGILNENDLINKHKKMGLDETIMRDIIAQLKGIKGVVDVESKETS